MRFVSDRRGWWQPYLHSGWPETGEECRPLSDLQAEWHGPDWVLGQRTMAELPDGTIVGRVSSAGRDAVVALEPAAPGRLRRAREVAQPCVSVAALCAHGDGFAVLGSTRDQPTNVWLCAPSGTRPLRRAGARAAGTGDVATGEPFTAVGRSGRDVQGTFYRPLRPEGPEAPGPPPPLLVWCHGGPTGACPSGLDQTLQYFASRGFAVACVDYAGSSGYGRAYRCALWGLWGVADAEDCLDAAAFLAARGEVDRTRMAARGTSAGGMTALNALATGEGLAAAVAWYGVTDLVALVSTTHDFEAHYTDRLIGPWPAARVLYEERSPLHRAHEMTGAVLLLQGTEDPVVPPEQAERLHDALVAAGNRCDLRFFEGEGHGFRGADTLAACLEAELAFYLDVLRL